MKYRNKFLLDLNTQPEKTQGQYPLLWPAVAPCHPYWYGILARTRSTLCRISVWHKGARGVDGADEASYIEMTVQLASILTGRQNTCRLGSSFKEDLLYS